MIFIPGVFPNIWRMSEGHIPESREVRIVGCSYIDWGSVIPGVKVSEE